MMILPDKASALIRVALVDLEKAENDPRYVIDMNFAYHTPREDYCSVCLAGVVMAFSLNLSIEDNISMSDFPIKTMCQFMALDNFRVGDVSTGMRILLARGDLPKELEGWEDGVASYQFEPEKFKQQVRGIADRLEVLGY